MNGAFRLPNVRQGLATFHDFVLAAVIGKTFDYAVKDHTVMRISRNSSDGNFRQGLTAMKRTGLMPFYSGSCT
jgi:hypothetical protein